MAKLYILNGPDKGRTFELADGPHYIGRSPENDIRIVDRTISRRHLKIIGRGGKYYIVDLQSMNRTFYNGNYMAPGLEQEVKPGIPIVIGMSVIGIGESCVEVISPFLDSIGLSGGAHKESGAFADHRNKSNQKKLELIYRVSDTLSAGLPVNKTLYALLGQIFDLLRRIDKGAFILTDSSRNRVTSVVSRSKRPSEQIPGKYCRQVIKRVLAEEKPLTVFNARAGQGDDLLDTLRILGIESVMCTPLMARSDLKGVMYVDSRKNPFGFRKDDLSLFVELSRRIALYLDDTGPLEYAV